VCCGWRDINRLDFIIDVESVYSAVRTESLYNADTFRLLNAKLNPICHLLALGALHILHVGRIRVNAVAVDKG
jgi:hypothetical protein